MLLQSAHAASRAGMGATCHLLKKAFYWPSLDEDARRYSWTCKVQRRLRTGRGRRAPRQEAVDETVTAAHASDHAPARKLHPTCGPSNARPRTGRRLRTLQGVEPRPGVTLNGERQSDLPPYEPPPVAELAQVAARQPLPQRAGLSAPPGFGPLPWTWPPARVPGPSIYPLVTAPPGEENSEELRQRFEELAENMRGTARRMQAAIREYEMMAEQMEPSRNGEDLDQAAPDQAPADQTGLIAEGDVPSQDCSCCGLPIAESRPCPH